MKRALFHMARFRLTLCCAALTLAGCATVPQARLVPQERIEQGLVAGQTSSAQALSALGEPSLMVKFDDGHQVWLYEYAVPGMAPDSKGAPQNGEVVVLFSRDGIAQKIRRRPSE